MSDISGARQERGTSGTRLSRVQMAYRSKTRTAWLAAGAATALIAVLALWIVPWVPIGMTQHDSNPAETVAFVLVAGSALIGLLASLTRELATTGKDVAEVWHGLLGGNKRLRNRAQFRYRLAKECMRARRDGRRWSSLFLIGATPTDAGNAPDGREALEYVAHTLAAGLRSKDVIGVVSETELGVLAIGANQSARQAIAARLSRTVADALLEWRETNVPSETLTFSLGAYTLDSSDDADSSIAAARQTLRPVTAQDARPA